jgi:hypothetical protein
MEERHQQVLRSILAAEFMLDLYRRAVTDRNHTASLRCLQVRKDMLAKLKTVRRLPVKG